MLFSCHINTSQKEEENKTGKEYTSNYVCPMHCEGSGSDAPGTCPVCKMDYVKNEKTDEYSEKKYACPIHSDITGNKGDTCTICNMDLEPVSKENNH